MKSVLVDGESCNFFVLEADFSKRQVTAASLRHPARCSSHPVNGLFPTKAHSLTTKYLEKNEMSRSVHESIRPNLPRELHPTRTTSEAEQDP